ncbi:hypothetical protein A5884_000987, partial [Enterococcus sp. 7D2_DIV0200]
SLAGEVPLVAEALAFKIRSSHERVRIIKEAKSV